MTINAELAAARIVDDARIGLFVYVYVRGILQLSRHYVIYMVKIVIHVMMNLVELAHFLRHRYTARETFKFYF